MITFERVDFDKHWADLYAWRNDPATREASLSQDLVGIEEHRTWLKATLAKASVHLFVVRDTKFAECDIKIGTARLDLINATTVELSLTVAPRARGRGYAAQTIYHLLKRIPEEFPKAKTVRALVREHNYPSLCAFTACKFTYVKARDGVVELVHKREA
jgi:L-amino acid N-acyltransferase YncA